MKNTETQEAFQRCREGSCDCPTDKYDKLDSMQIEHDVDRISLQLKVKPGLDIDQAAVAACLDHTLKKSEEMAEYCTSCPKQMTLKQYVALGFLNASLLIGQASAEVITSEEAQTGLRTWEWREAGVSVQLVQRLPDQTRAFFQARGFTSKDADTIGRACVFQTIFRNDGKQLLSYNLDDWHISYQAKRRSLFTRERWDEKWQESGASQAALIALRWSLLPTRQRFEPGDYNWGMTSFGIPPGEVFDLTLVLTRHADPITRTIPGIVCAADQSRDEP